MPRTSHRELISMAFRSPTSPCQWLITRPSLLLLFRASPSAPMASSLFNTLLPLTVTHARNAREAAGK